eukprot:SAG25_NODE_729_length_5691_cov_223.244234_9_plen_72_part_00
MQRADVVRIIRQPRVRGNGGGKVSCLVSSRLNESRIEGHAALATGIVLHAIIRPVSSPPIPIHQGLSVEEG